MVDLSMLIVFNIVAVVASYFLAYFTLKALMYRRYVNRGFMSLNKILSSDKIFYEMIMIMLNCVASAAMVVSSLINSSETFFMFLGWWFIYKLVIAAFSYAISQAVKRNVLIMLVFTATFFSLSLVGVSYLITNF